MIDFLMVLGAKLWIRHIPVLSKIGYKLMIFGLAHDQKKVKS